MTDPQQDEVIEGGATGEDLPLFVRREAARQAERLAADHMAHAAASEARLTSILSWSTAALVAGTLWAATPHKVTWPLAVAAIALGSAALLSVAALWPRRWVASGYTLAELTRFGAESEYEHFDMVARGLNEASCDNGRRMATTARLLRGAWLGLLIAAAAALIGILTPTVP